MSTPINLNTFRGLPNTTRRQPQLPQNGPAIFAPSALHQKQNDTLELRFSGSTETAPPDFSDLPSDVDSDPEAKNTRKAKTKRKEKNEKQAEKFRNNKINSRQLIEAICPNVNGTSTQDYGGRHALLKSLGLYTTPRKYQDAKSGQQEHAMEGFIDTLFRLSNTSDGDYLLTGTLRKDFERDLKKYSNDAFKA